MSEANPTPPSRSPLDAILASTQTHKTYWYAGGGVVAVAAIAAVVVFGGFLGPSGKDICTLSLDQAKAFGVISPSATLDSTSAKKTDVNNRRQCTVKADGDTYTILADIKSEDMAHKKCKNVKQANCLAIYSVARSDGVTTYQVREIPPDQTDEAVLAAQGAPQVPPVQGAAPADAGAAPAAAPSGGGMDTDTAVDNSGTTQNAPQQ